MAILAAVIAFVCMFCSVFAGWVAPHNPFDLTTLELSDARLPPAWRRQPTYLLGTDDQGRDILSALIYGARISLVVGVASVMLSVVVGVALGLLAGFKGGWIDALLMRLCDVMLSFPAILVALLIAGVGRALFPNAHESLAFGVLILSISLTGWVQYARTVRGSTLVERNKEYVQAARVTGVSPCASCAPRAAQRDGAGAGAGHHPGGHGHHHRGHAVLPGRGRAAHLALAGHADPRRQRLPVLGRMVDHRLPRRHAGADRAVGQPAGRLAARRAEPAPALNKNRSPMSLLKSKTSSSNFQAPRHLRALDDVSFDIAPGEILGVVGESGAGKSLTGAAIIGLLEPPGRVASGQILLEGQRIDNLPPRADAPHPRPQIGAIFQDPLTSLNPLYTVGRQLVETIQAHLPVSAEARQRAIRLLQDTGIPAAEQRIDHYPHQFSAACASAW
jgi:hypothetical protein